VTPQTLIETCLARGIRLWTNGTGALRFSALPGAMDDALKAQLSENRSALAAHLSGRTDLPLNALQRAYLAGQAAEDLDLGGIAPLYYLELAGERLDADRLDAALAEMTAIHAVLGMSLAGTADGSPVLRPVEGPVPRIARIACATPAERAALQARMMEGPQDPERFPLFDLRLSRLAGTPDHLHILIDLTLLDAHSGALFISELLARSRGAEPRPPAVTAAGLRALEKESADDRAWWHARLADLPEAPALPLKQPLHELRRPRFGRVEGILSAPGWQTLRDRAQEHGITPSACLGAVFAETLGIWAGSGEDCLLSLTLFQRPGTHPDRDAVLGDFTNLLPLACPVRAETPLAHMRQVQERLWQAAAHAGCSGTEILAALARHRNRPGRAAAPVVFTSLLGRGSAGPVSLIPEGMTQCAALSQTPQVALDCQVHEDRGALRISWDHAADLFDANGLAEAFSAHLGRLEALAAAPDWAALPAASFRTPAAAPDAPRLGRMPPATRPAFEAALDAGRIAECWAEVLPGFDGRRDIGFFEAGGSSLLAVRLQAALSRAAGRDVPIHIVFDHPTVLAQAAAFSPRPQPPARAASRRRFRQMAQSRDSTTRG